MSPPTLVEIEGHQLKLTNLDKVLYPEAGFTKAEVVDYYARIAPVMLPHLRDRIVTFRRFPDGVDGESFFEKRCPGHRPEWVPVAEGPGDRGGPIRYCVLDSVAALVWAANLAALELHTPMSRAGDMHAPTMVVFDLDPGPPAGMAACAEVALLIRDTLAGLGLRSVAKTSGSKGLQLYVPLNCYHHTDHAKSFSLAVAQLIEKHHPSLVVTDQKKELRRGKVLIDWSQNAYFKTTICAYSLRARPRPTVSTPVTWDEVEAAAGGQPLSFEAAEVLDRVERLGDLFADAASLEQRIPAPMR
ncbi:non-homologous end-joining DNA ligase [Rhabdothermincola sediminis]|uniref:non-homologous end-joining DNA ligase n=1 Tax=Rhabdothermincola sediminis TaxID=2751370 RepID=UPI001AA05369